MITYTYKCGACEHTFEIQQRITDDALVECPECEKNELKKVIQTAGGFRIGGLGVHKPTTHWGDY